MNKQEVEEEEGEEKKLRPSFLSLEILSPAYLLSLLALEKGILSPFTQPSPKNNLLVNCHVTGDNKHFEMVTNYSWFKVSYLRQEKCSQPEAFQVLINFVSGMACRCLFEIREKADIFGTYCVSRTMPGFVPW